jgi:ribonuclease P protein component
MSLTFPGAVRLHTRVEFDAVQERGRRVSARYVTIIGRPNALDCDRLGIIASRRVGGAVARNRAKRRLRELFRREAPASARAAGRQPMDVVVVARPALVSAPFAAVREDFRVALKKLREER